MRQQLDGQEMNPLIAILIAIAIIAAPTLTVWGVYEATTGLAEIRQSKETNQ